VLAPGVFAQERGFAVHRYDSTTAGSRFFLVVRPWYSMNCGGCGVNRPDVRGRFCCQA